MQPKSNSITVSCTSRTGRARTRSTRRCSAPRWFARGEGFAYRFGDTQLNLHGPGVDAVPVARDPVRPGNSDLCFEWPGPIADAAAHLERCGVAVELGPVERAGAKGAGRASISAIRTGRCWSSFRTRQIIVTLLKCLEAQNAQSCTIRRSCPRTFRCRSDDGAARHLDGRAAAGPRACRRPTARRSTFRRSAGPHRRLCLSAHRPARTADRRPAGTAFRARAAARRNPAGSATTSPS